jgi:hypothetical protein
MADECPRSPHLSNSALHLSYTLTEPLLGQSTTTAGKQIGELGVPTVLPRHPLDVVLLASPARFADDRQDSATDVGQGLSAIAGMMASRVHENESRNQGLSARPRPGTTSPSAHTARRCRALRSTAAPLNMNVKAPLMSLEKAKEIRWKNCPKNLSDFRCGGARSSPGGVDAADTGNHPCAAG